MESVKYLKHAAGIAALIEWMKQNRRLGYEFSHSAHSVACCANVARRFLIGTPVNKKFGKNPFFAIQRPEASFLSLLAVSKVAFVQDKPALHIVCPMVRGDDKEYPDLPAFFIEFAFNSIDKAEVFQKAKNIHCCPFWFDDGKTSIALKDKIWTAPVAWLAPSEPILTDKELRSAVDFKELMRRKIDSTNVAVNPGFVG